MSKIIRLDWYKWCRWDV